MYRGMAEIRTVTTLKSKKRDIENAIAGYEKRLQQSRADLAAINAAIAIFEATGEREGLQPYTDVYRLFARGEQWRICKEVLAEGPKDTRELALAIMKAKGLDLNDLEIAKSLTGRLIHALRMQHKRGNLEMVGKRKARMTWRLSTRNPQDRG